MNDPRAHQFINTLKAEHEVALTRVTEERDRAIAERDNAMRERDRLLLEVTRLAGENERLTEELTSPARDRRASDKTIKELVGELRDEAK